MKRNFLIIIACMLAAYQVDAQDTLHQPMSCLINQNVDMDNICLDFACHNTQLAGFAYEFSTEGNQKVYGVLLWAREPIADYARLVLYLREHTTAYVFDSIQGSHTTPYRRHFSIKGCVIRWPGHDSTWVTPCYLYLFDSPIDGLGTFYLGINPSSFVMDQNYYEYFATIGNNDNNVPCMYIGEDNPNAGLSQYQILSRTGFYSNVFPVVELPCLMPTKPRISRIAGDSTRVTWGDGGDYYQVQFVRNGFAKFVSDTLEGLSFTIADSLLEAGEYSVQVRKACRYTTATYDTVVWSEWSPGAPLLVTAPVGIDGEVGGMRYEVRLRPNPASGTVTVESGEWRVESVTVTDLAGREVMVTTDVHEGTPLQLDISRLTPGVYMVTVVTDHGSASQRLVVQ